MTFQFNEGIQRHILGIYQKYERREGVLEEKKKWSESRMEREIMMKEGRKEGRKGEINEERKKGRKEDMEKTIEERNKGEAKRYNEGR